MKTARLETRIPADKKAVIEQAAALRGQSVTAFTVSTVYDAALRTIEEIRGAELNARDSERFVTSLLNPPAPNAQLRKALGAHRKTVRK